MAMRTHWSTLADALKEVEALTLIDTRGDAHALFDARADALPEVEAVTLGDIRAMRTHCSTLGLSRLQRWWR